MERALSGNTVLAYISDCSRFSDFLDKNYPSILPEDISVQIINEFIESIIKFKGKNEEERLLKSASVTRIIQSLRAFFKFLTIYGVLDKDISQLVLTPKTDNKLPVVLEQEEIFKMMDCVEKNTHHGFRNYLTIEFLYATGLRVSEFINLKLENINFKNEYLDIIGKGDKERFVPVASKVIKDLRFYIEKLRANIDIRPEYKDYVFISEKRRGKMTRQFINKMLNETAVKAGITKKIHPHILRHSFATELIRCNANIIAVKEMMGHASVASTEIYINLNNKDLRNTLEHYHPLYKNKNI